MSGRRPKGDGHGMTAFEALVMEMWDGGMSSRQIADSLGRNYSTVQSVVGNFRYTEAEDLRTNNATRDASRRLGAACAALKARGA